MTFLVHTLPQHGIILATVMPPVIRGEKTRIYKALINKLERRSDRETIHLVLNIALLDRSDAVPAQHYIAILSKIYEEWYYRRTLVLWIAVADCYRDTVDYMVQKLCLPAYVHDDQATILTQINETYGITTELIPKES